MGSLLKFPQKLDVPKSVARIQLENQDFSRPAKNQDFNNNPIQEIGKPPASDHTFIF